MYILFFEIFKFLIVIYYDLSNWDKTKLLRTFSFQTVADFLSEVIICGHNCFRKLIFDRKSENKDAIVELAKRYEIKRW